MRFELLISSISAHLPALWYFAIANGDPRPKWLTDLQEKEIEEKPLQLYHGTAPCNAAHIGAGGFARTIGTGCDKLADMWGVPMGGARGIAILSRL